MVSEATRGVMFVLKTELDKDYKRAFNEIVQEAGEVQKHLDSLKVGIQTTGDNATAPLTKQPQKVAVSIALAPDWKKPLDTIRAEIASLQKAATIKVDVQTTGSVAQTTANKQAARRASVAGNGAVGSTGGTAGNGKAPDPGHKGLEQSKRDYEERERLRAEKTADIVKKANQESIEQQIKDLKKAEAARQKTADAAEKEAKRQADAEIKQIQRVAEAREASIKSGYKALSAIGADAYGTGKKLDQGMDALSAMGRDALRSTGGGKWAEGLRQIAEERDRTTGWRGLSEIGKHAAEKNEAATKRESLERKKAALEAKESAALQREAEAKVQEGIDATIDSVSKLARGFAQLGLVGESDMHKIVDTMLAVQGTIDTVKGGLDSLRSAGPVLKGLLNFGGKAGGAALAGGAAAGEGAAALGGAGAAAAAAPIAPIAAAAAGVAAAIGSAVMVIREASVVGFGRGGRVGGFVDTAATKMNSVGSGIAGMGLSVAGDLYNNMTAPYGLTDRELEERKEGFMERHSGIGTAAIAATGPLGWAYLAATGNESSKLALSNARTERMTKNYLQTRTKEEQNRDLREELDSAIEPLKTRGLESSRSVAQQKFGMRLSNVRARGAVFSDELTAAFGREQTAHAEQLSLQQQGALGNFVDTQKAARVAGERAREEGRVTEMAEREKENLRNQLRMTMSRGSEIGADLTGARQRKDSGDTEAARKEAFADELRLTDELKQNLQQQVQLKERIRQVGIEGAKRELALSEQSLATAKQTADALRQQGQSATERFGQMLPEQQRAIVASARAAKQAEQTGQQLPKYQLDQLRQFPELAGAFVRKQDVANAKRGGIDELLNITGFKKSLSDAEGKENQLGKLVVDQRQHITAELNANVEQTAKTLLDALIPLIESANKATAEEVKKEVEAAIRDARRRHNSQTAQTAA